MLGQTNVIDLSANTQCTGHYLSFLPRSDRDRVVTYFDDAYEEESEPNMWFHYKSVREYNTRRLENVHGIDRSDPRNNGRDKTINLGLKVNIVLDGHKPIRYKVERVGAPLAIAQLRDIFGNTSTFKMYTSMQALTISSHVYTMSRIVVKKTGKQHRAPEKVHEHFMRVLEDGTFIKLPDQPVGEKINSIATASPSMDNARKFRDICANALKRLYEALREAMHVSTEASVLLKILRDTYEYRDMHVHYPNKLSDKPKRGQKAIGNSKLSACKCAVGGCYMFPSINSLKRNESMKADMVVYLQHSVEYKDGRYVDRDVTKKDISYNLCKKHGNLVVCAWYLLNQEAIWTYEFYHTLSMDSRSKITLFNNVSEAFHQSMKLNKDMLANYKRKTDSSIMYIDRYVSMVRAGIQAISNRNS
jgi:hypothetical protein